MGLADRDYMHPHDCSCERCRRHCNSNGQAKSAQECKGTDAESEHNVAQATERKAPILYECLSCGSLSLLLNTKSNLYECLNPGCRSIFRNKDIHTSDCTCLKCTNERLNKSAPESPSNEKYEKSPATRTSMKSTNIESSTYTSKYYDDNIADPGLGRYPGGFDRKPRKTNKGGISEMLGYVLRFVTGNVIGCAGLICLLLLAPFSIITGSLVPVAIFALIGFVLLGVSSYIKKKG